MKKAFHIPKYRLYGEIDYSAVLSYNAVGKCKLQPLWLEEIPLPTGRICFFDPYRLRDVKPFLAEFSAGTARPFAYTLSVAKEQRIAFAGLDCGGLASAKEWRLALCEERDVLKLLADDGIAGVRIENGWGAMCDAATFEDFSQLARKAANAFHPLDGMLDMSGNGAQVCTIRGIRLPVFAADRGEATYACYVGIGADGKAKGILCDFALIKPSRKVNRNATVAFVFDVPTEDLYVADPKKSETENAIAKYSSVIGAKTIDIATLFQAYSRRGYSYHVAEQYEEALADYLQAIAIGHAHEVETDFRNHARALYENAAGIYHTLGRRSEEIALYEEALNCSDMFNNMAYVNLIRIYREEKDYVQALSVAQKMVTVRPQDPSAYLMRSEIFMECEEYEKAIADLDVLIDVYKLNESMLDKAVCLSHLGKNEEALRVLDAYLLDGSAGEDYYCIRAGIHLADNHLAAAYVDMIRAYDANPDYSVTLERLIELDGRLCNYKNVVRWATRYIDLHPHAEYGYSVRADAYMRIEAYEEAIADYAYLVHHVTDTPKYRGLLVKAYLSAGDKGTAKKYGKALRKDGGAYYFYAIGLLLAAEKRYARAERFLATAFTLKEDDVILFALIDCYILSGKTEKAAAAIPTLAEIAEPEEVYLTEARLAKLRGESMEKFEKEYIRRFLGDCGDEGLCAGIVAFFRELR